MNSTEEQMLNALREGIKATIARPEEACKDDTSELVELLRNYKANHPDAEIYVETKYGIMSQKLSECEIYSPNGQNIMLIWK